MPARPAVAPAREAPTTRDLILDAAERRFAERGFAGVSMRAIAAEAGLKNQASLYTHFRDKRALYEAVLARGIGPIVGLLASTGDGTAAGTPLSVAVVHGVVDRLLDYVEERPHLPRLIERAGLDDARRVRTTLTRLLRPLYAHGLRVLAGTRWQPDELPHVAALLQHFIFGYFANAALLEVVMQQDPRSPAALARHRRVLKTAVTELLGLAPARRLRPRPPRHR